VAIKFPLTNSLRCHYIRMKQRIILLAQDDSQLELASNHRECVPAQLNQTYLLQWLPWWIQKT
jgi:hypothetical protein